MTDKTQTIIQARRAGKTVCQLYGNPKIHPILFALQQIADERGQRILKWCEDNCEGKYEVHMAPNPVFHGWDIEPEFELDSDAVKFKLAQASIND